MPLTERFKPLLKAPAMIETSSRTIIIMLAMNVALLLVAAAGIVMMVFHGRG